MIRQRNARTRKKNVHPFKWHEHRLGNGWKSTKQNLESGEVLATYKKIKLYGGIDLKDRHYCQLGGKIRGTAHQSCNLNVKEVKSSSVFSLLNDSSGTDSHLFIKKIFSYSPSSLNCKPLPTTTNEHFIRFCRRTLDSFSFL